MQTQNWNEQSTPRSRLDNVLLSFIAVPLNGLTMLLCKLQGKALWLLLHTRDKLTNFSPKFPPLLQCCIIFSPTVATLICFPQTFPPRLQPYCNIPTHNLWPEILSWVKIHTKGRYYSFRNTEEIHANPNQEYVIPSVIISTVRNTEEIHTNPD